MTTTYPQGLNIIVGLGKTGLSCAHYLAKQHIPFAVVDNRSCPPVLAELREYYPDTPLHLGDFSWPIMEKAARLIVSPGVAITEPAIWRCHQQGIPVIGDIELFAQVAKAPIVAVTGSNAKGTVVTLVGNMAALAKRDVCVGGNIGTPALELLAEEKTDLYVLELSSFQLETTYSLHAEVATILNISPDHLDRYPSMSDYIKAKQRIYQGCRKAVYNRDDLHTKPTIDVPTISFGLDTPPPGQFGLQKKSGVYWLSQGDECWLSTQDLRIKGRHNWANALSACALGEAINLPRPAMLQALREFKGLAHRCEWVAEKEGVQWYNDSKGTNVGATIAAIQGLGSDIAGKLILIAGGLGKGADFSVLRAPIASHVKSVIVLGKDAPILEKALQNSAPILHADSMEQAVSLAKKQARTGDAVLLSPACASFDMFDNFEHRGEVYKTAVRNVLS